MIGQTHAKFLNVVCSYFFYPLLSRVHLPLRKKEHHKGSTAIMRMKTFSAPSMSQALKVVEEQMGKDAIILSSKENTKDGIVHVTAGLDPDFISLVGLNNTGFPQTASCICCSLVVFSAIPIPPPQTFYLFVWGKPYAAHRFGKRRIIKNPWFFWARQAQEKPWLWPNWQHRPYCTILNQF
jgi:hypothetical protein